MKFTSCLQIDARVTLTLLLCALSLSCKTSDESRLNTSLRQSSPTKVTISCQKSSFMVDVNWEVSNFKNITETRQVSGKIDSCSQVKAVCGGAHLTLSSSSTKNSYTMTLADDNMCIQVKNEVDKSLESLANGASGSSPDSSSPEIEAFCQGGQTFKINVSYSGNKKSAEIQNCSPQLTCEGNVFKIQSQSQSSTIPLADQAMCMQVKSEVQRAIDSAKTQPSPGSNNSALKITAVCQANKTFKVDIAYGLETRTVDAPNCSPQVSCQGHILVLKSSSSSSTAPLQDQAMCTQAMTEVKKAIK